MDKPPSVKFDEESAAIKTLLETLAPLTPDVRAEVIRYVATRLGISKPLGEARTPFQEGPKFEPPLPSAESGEIHIKTFKDQKKPKSANEMAAVVFLANLAKPDDRKEAIDVQDIRTYFKIADFPLPEQIRFTLTNATNAGYFDSVGRGTFRLNAIGHNLVAHSLPRDGASSQPRRSRNRRGAKKAKPRIR